MQSMQTFHKKRIEIIVEAPVLRLVTERLDALGATGYTVVPALGGRGRGGSWRREGLVSDVGQMVVIICIVDAERASGIVDSVYEVVSRQIGVVTISDVHVIRDDHF
jgi:nitrogen regulatory protein PII